jgi:predicted MPP superfamily phosphohydrolase
VITRRAILRGASAFLLGGVALAGYGLGIEPHALLRVARYEVGPRRWPPGLRLRLAIISDLHVCEPWVGVSRIRQIVERTNGLGADLVLLLGDYVSAHPWVTGPVAYEVWARELARLEAPLGVHAVLGNHDWWEDRAAMRARRGPVAARRALERARVPVYENDAVRLEKGGRPFWLAGLGDQWAFGSRFGGIDDLPGTLAKAGDAAPVILLAHEPDVFPRVPERVALTLSGHTHGGQVRILGYSPIVPSRYGNRYAYGHIVERDRHLVVSGGLGCTGLPVRFGVPPEIVQVDVGA